MPDDRICRIGDNEALYRQVNEQVENINKGMVETMGEFDVLCECGTLQCTEQITVSTAVYEGARSDSHRFIVRPGHQVDDMEVVVADHGTFYVIEKTPREARELAEEQDARE
jgi:hypothetical protein